MIDKEILVEQLHAGKCTVVFTKKDGTTRTMNCTLNPTLANLPTELKEETKCPPDNPNLVTVWDTDFNGWRSFRMDSVESFNTPTRTLIG